MDYSINMDSNVMYSVNYEYENDLNSLSESELVPQCYLLLGQVQNGKDITISRNIKIPITLEAVTSEFGFDDKNLEMKIELIRVTEPNLDVIGLLLVNPKVFDYDSIMHRLMERIVILFRYEADNKLECYVKMINDFKLVDFQYKFNSVQVMNSKEDKKGGNISTYEKHQLEETNYRNVVEKLIIRINTTLNYLQKSEEPNDLILRKISMIISGLKRPVTEDIEKEIINHENEIKLLEIVLNQWEMTVSD
ncbi:hypothetical protein KAFR_0A02200 [Kazachstania africana CBS 2517]|uniref:Rpn11/EIF3F C-terminal domain-containing protein n=1 Tax=Kazachstania africana (strain ATCC 22294 / BCRC 22015 / CBS 2517 / CECT 1963 / NBRC 1671 / NRRL Y-8276) TaxID=1071382 RepID=H2AMQ8_KAZAF|nr:hypothetical protein KAFR_0A02200 [Kazachstania africana CBS 2517]CCF55658.1 hypothetical protein KAFR_0A02200 [Kazachstania africana CBS 2517]